MNIQQIEAAAKIIVNGGLVAFPTETVYGLGANALNPLAVAKIFELKERPSFDPLIVHIASMSMLHTLTSSVSDNVLLLAKKFWPGPLTIVLPKSQIVPDIVTSGLPTVGIRMPDNEIALKLIERTKCPIAAPSANKFGNLSPVTAYHVKKQLPNVDFILDGGATSVGIESTIISLEENVCTLLRPGIITIEEISKVLPGNFSIITRENSKIMAPGQLKSHYSPQKPLYIIENLNIKFPANSGLILHNKRVTPNGTYKTLYTSLNFNLLEIAANLFSTLHNLEDDSNINQIFIEPVIETGLGVAIMDRIKKASFKYNNSK